MAWGTYEEEKALRVLCRKLKDRDHFEELKQIGYNINLDLTKTGQNGMD